MTDEIPRKEIQDRIKELIKESYKSSTPHRGREFMLEQYSLNGLEILEIINDLAPFAPSVRKEIEDAQESTSEDNDYKTKLESENARYKSELEELKKNIKVVFDSFRGLEKKATE